MTYVEAKATENGFGIEFVDGFGSHVGWLKKSDGTTKVWRLREHADRVIENGTKKYGWLRA